MKTTRDGRTERKPKIDTTQSNSLQTMISLSQPVPGILEASALIPTRSSSRPACQSSTRRQKLRAIKLGMGSVGGKWCRAASRLNPPNGSALQTFSPESLPRTPGRQRFFSTSTSIISRRREGTSAKNDIGNANRKVTLLSSFTAMSLTTKQRIEREKQRREAANARMREKVAAARRRGICRCGGKLDKKPGTRRNYSTCPDCREKAIALATRYYREGPLQPRVRPPAKLDGRLRDSTGVRRRLERDGFGREAWCWFANTYINGRQRTRRWSVDKHGDRGAWRHAMEQRREWERSI